MTEGIFYLVRFRRISHKKKADIDNSENMIIVSDILGKPLLGIKLCERCHAVYWDSVNSKENKNKNKNI
jgi:hypothetical protein